MIKGPKYPLHACTSVGGVGVALECVWTMGHGGISSKKLLLRDFSSFSPYQIFSPKKSPMFGFLVPKVPGTNEKVPITKQGLSQQKKTKLNFLQYALFLALKIC